MLRICSVTRRCKSSLHCVSPVNWGLRLVLHHRSAAKQVEWPVVDEVLQEIGSELAMCVCEAYVCSAAWVNQS